MEIVSELLGHSNMTITQESYGKIVQKKSVIAVARKLLVYIYMILSSKSPYNAKLDMT